jgi:hypothetical protein
MKAPGSAPNQQQRKEADGKENVTMSTDIEEHEVEPEVARAVIYLCGPEPGSKDQVRDIPPIYQQRMSCRIAAAVMHAEVVREYVDESRSTPWRPELHNMVRMVGEGRPVDYLIVYSKDLLANNSTDMYETAWCLGVAGTSVIAIDENDLSAWTER